MPQAEPSKLRQFNPENCDIRTQLMWEEWATIPAFKVLTLLLARKGKSIFSSQGISEMLAIPKSTVIHALKLLRDNEYILKEGGSYYLNIGRVSDQPIGQATNALVSPTNPLVSVDQPIGQDSTNPLVTNNDKEIIIKNDDKENGEALTFTPDFDLKEIRTWTYKWRDKLRSLKPPRDLSQIALDALMMRYHEKPQAFLAALIHSCSLSEAKNLYDAPEKKAEKILKSLPPPRKEYRVPDRSEKTLAQIKAEMSPGHLEKFNRLVGKA